MRDEWGPIDPDEIDLIEPDESAFGQAAGPSPGRHDDAPRRARPRWLVPVAAGCGLAAVAVAALAVWQPWAEDGPLQLATGTVGEPELSDQLVLAAAGSPSEAASDIFLNDDIRELLESTGYVFASSGAAIQFDETAAATGRWAAIGTSTLEERGPDTEDLGSLTVRGAPAVLEDGPPDGVSVRYGPIDGLYFNLVAVGLDDQGALRLAEAITVDGDVITVTDRAALAGMEPVGPVGSYYAAAGLRFTVTEPGFIALVGTSVCYDDGDTCLVHAPAFEEPSPEMLDLIFGEGTATTVHGVPARLVTAPVEDFFGGGEDRREIRVVVWVEGGRVLAVRGDLSDDELVRLAESTREATPEEWAEVEVLLNQPAVFTP